MAQKIDLTPSIANVRAIVETQWEGRSYRPRVVNTIESYTVDTAMDTDADSWSVEIGDPYGDLAPDCLRRDAEVRVQLFGVGGGIDYIMTGISDEVEFGDDGILTLTGRDYSSIAMDSTVPPKQYRHVRAWAIVDQQAKEIGFKRTQLARGTQIKKVQHTDGSESYWEFWYRLYRKEKMWIWTLPNGTLKADFLNYGSAPVYFLGWPKADDSEKVKAQHIPVEQLAVRKSTQQRVGEVWVYAHKGQTGFHTEPIFDPTMKSWIKKPRKILLDANAHTMKSAIHTAWEEIFEGKVGELEYTVTIPDPGFILKQNQIARLRIPQLNIAGDFFVVGVRVQTGINGAVQELRLRDRRMALTNRIPTEPKALGTPAPRQQTVQTELGGQIATGVDVPTSWGIYFTSSAKEFCGHWDYNLFLACLLGICSVESSFKNIRQNGGPGGSHIEWRQPPTQKEAEKEFSITFFGKDSSSRGAMMAAMEEWKTLFANEQGDGYVNMEFGVGPMQLTDRGVKHDADDHFRPDFRDEFQGGRWNPESNIWAAAKYFRQCLKDTVQDSGKDEDIWMGVMAYNRGAGGALSYFAQHGRVSSYAQSVRKAVETDPGFLASIKTSRDIAQQNAAAPGTPPVKYDQPPSPKPGKVNSKQALESLTWIKPLSGVHLEQVDWRLLVGVNNLGKFLGKQITITSGFRTFDEQVQAWNNQNHNPLLAANPYTKTSNHQLGEAVDCTIDGVAIGKYVDQQTMEKFGIHCSVYIQYGTDPVHVTLIGVWH